jgi:hypothetical protein
MPMSTMYRRISGVRRLNTAPPNSEKALDTTYTSKQRQASAPQLEQVEGAASAAGLLVLLLPLLGLLAASASLLLLLLVLWLGCPDDTLRAGADATRLMRGLELRCCGTMSWSAATWVVAQSGMVHPNVVLSRAATPYGSGAAGSQLPGCAMAAPATGTCYRCCTLLRYPVFAQRAAVRPSWVPSPEAQQLWTLCTPERVRLLLHNTDRTPARRDRRSCAPLGL